MNDPKNLAALEVSGTTRTCPIGETVGKRGLETARIPVLSCEGACIRGEIARQAANLIAKDPRFGRACHGELLTAPRSSIARWVLSARRVVLIDGCFMRCHGRILENLLAKDQLVQFDALAVHKKYCNVFDAEEVAEAERKKVAREVADHVLGRLDLVVQPSEREPVRATRCGACAATPSDTPSAAAE